jgi:hypothetical protein
LLLQLQNARNLSILITYRLPELKTTIKAGGSNIFNLRDKHYIQYAPGPTIGGLYDVAITVDGLFNQ